MSARATVRSLIERLSVGAKIESYLSGTKVPGFSHALGTSLPFLEASELLKWDQDKSELRMRYRVDPRVCLDGKSASLSACLALIDENTSHAVLAAKKSTDLRPGVSVNLQAELFKPVSAGKQVDLVSTVTRMGRNLAFCSAVILCQDGSLLCRGTHIKYLPMDSYFVDSFLSQSWSWPLLKAYFNHKSSIDFSHNCGDLGGLVGSNLILPTDEAGFGSFRIERKHSNALNSMHGGCHAVVMEVVSQPLASKSLGTQTGLDSMQVQYHSAAKGEVNSQAIVVSSDEAHVTIRVLLTRPRDGKIMSDGTLRWRRKD